MPLGLDSRPPGLLDRGPPRGDEHGIDLPALRAHPVVLRAIAQQELRAQLVQRAHHRGAQEAPKEPNETMGTWGQ